MNSVNLRHIFGYWCPVGVSLTSQNIYPNTTHSSRLSLSSLSCSVSSLLQSCHGGPWEAVTGAQDEATANSTRKSRHQQRPSCWGASEATHGQRLPTNDWRLGGGGGRCLGRDSAQIYIPRRQGAGSSPHVGALGRRRTGTDACEPRGLGRRGAPVTAACPGLGQVMPLHTLLNLLPRF
jgi:hypothetical protein